MPENQNTTRRQPKNEDVGRLIKPSSRFEFSRMVVHPSVEEEVTAALSFIENRDEIEKVWKLSALTSIDRNVMNFYGPPGTGKTMIARCIARRLGLPLYQVDYSEVISCLVGQTAKNIKMAFSQAKKHKAILFFDEADSLCSRRVSASDVNYSTGINQNRNVFMQELDRFSGIVLLATNFFENFDEALLRRVAAHVKFELPTAEMRAKLFEVHIPAMSMTSELELDKLAELSEGLSGGDILNVCVNAIKVACLQGDDPQGWKLTQTMLLREVQRTLEAKRAHSGGRRQPKPLKVEMTHKVKNISKKSVFKSGSN